MPNSTFYSSVGYARCHLIMQVLRTLIGHERLVTVSGSRSASTARRHPVQADQPVAASNQDRYGPMLDWTRRSTWKRRSQPTIARPPGLTAVTGDTPLSAITCEVANVPVWLTFRARMLPTDPLMPWPS